MRIMPFAALAASLLLAGCFTADRSLYGGEKPVTPLHGGTLEVEDLRHPQAHKLVHLQLAPDGTYRLMDAQQVTRFRLFPLGALLVAEIADGCKAKDAGCEAKPGRSYALVRLMAGRVEWQMPDCSLVLSKLSGIKVKADPCQFYDRAALDKALHIAAAAPWKADGAYLLR